MLLTISLVQGISYSAKASSLPFLYKIAFETATTICGPIHVTACILENQESAEVSAGYARNIFSRPGIQRFVRAGAEFVLAVEVLEHEDDPSGLIPGRYELSAKVSVQVVQADGSVRHHDLRASREVVLT